MAAFQFSSDASKPTTTFNGTIFYNIYKNAEFLRSSANVETILSKGYELRQTLQKQPPGTYLKVEGMVLERNTPLLLKRTGPSDKVEDFEFTFNRLTGLVAAYAFENRLQFPIIKSSEAKALGLVWENTDTNKCKMYLSAVSGTEHFVAQFEYWPLVCALRKYQQNKMPAHLVVKMGNIKNDDGKHMAEIFMLNNQNVKKLWMYFPNSSPTDLTALLSVAPQELKTLFIKK